MSALHSDHARAARATPRAIHWHPTSSTLTAPRLATRNSRPAMCAAPYQGKVAKTAFQSPASPIQYMKVYCSVTEQYTTSRRPSQTCHAERERSIRRYLAGGVAHPRMLRCAQHDTPGNASHGMPCRKKDHHRRVMLSESEASEGIWRCGPRGCFAAAQHDTPGNASHGILCILLRISSAATPL